jgi:hypothetical protein
VTDRFDDAFHAPLFPAIGMDLVCRKHHAAT